MSNEVCRLNALLSGPEPLYLPRASSSVWCVYVCAVRSRDGVIIEKVGN